MHRRLANTSPPDAEGPSELTAPEGRGSKNVEWIALYSFAFPPTSEKLTALPPGSRTAYSVAP